MPVLSQAAGGTHRRGLNPFCRVRSHPAPRDQPSMQPVRFTLACTFPRGPPFQFALGLLHQLDEGSD